jgi:hypothetical protein
MEYTHQETDYSLESKSTEGMAGKNEPLLSTKKELGREYHPEEGRGNMTEWRDASPDRLLNLEEMVHGRCIM